MNIACSPFLYFTDLEMKPKFNTYLPRWWVCCVKNPGLLILILLLFSLYHSRPWRNCTATWCRDKPSKTAFAHSRSGLESRRVAFTPVTAGNQHSSLLNGFASIFHCFHLYTVPPPPSSSILLSPLPISTPHICKGLIVCGECCENLTCSRKIKTRFVFISACPNFQQVF